MAVEAVADYALDVRFASNRSRDAPLVVAMLPIFSYKYWEGQA